MKPLPTDRRQFLIGSTGLMLGGFGTIARGVDEAEDPIRLAVVGTGARGSDLIRALSTIEGARIVAVCDDYEPHLKLGLEYAGEQAQAFQDYAEMLAKAKPDAVVIAAPLNLHFSMCLRAIEAGCAIFCEKTMCYSLDQARELAKAVESSGLVFQVGLQRRANAIYKQAAAMVQTGMLGRITAIKAQWHRHNNWRRPVPVKRGDPSWNDLEHRLNWRLYRDSSQGLMAELASHQLDVATWLLGTPPQKAIGSGGIDYWRDGREVFDNIFCVYDYQVTPHASSPAPPGVEDGPYKVRVTYSSIQNNAYEGASELILGTKGTLFLTDSKGLFFREAGADDPGWNAEGRADRDASILTAGKTLKMSNDPWAHRGQPFEIDATGNDTRDELVSFLEHVRQGDPRTICDVRAGLINTATILIGEQAMREGRTVDFPDDLKLS